MDRNKLKNYINQLQPIELVKSVESVLSTNYLIQLVSFYWFDPKMILGHGKMG